MQILVDPHPRLHVVAFEARFPAPLGALPDAATDAQAIALERLASFFEVPDRNADAGAPAVPLQRDEAVRQAVRDMLRVGGYKPTGRGKPASEYLVRATEDGGLGPINAAVDACNVVSLHSGLPISVVDTTLARPPYRIAIATPGSRYVFNPGGQEIDLAGLVCLFDAEGACANAVRDSQRTKTHAGTTSTLSVIWGVVGHEERSKRAAEWYRALLHDVAAVTAPVAAAVV